MTARLLIACDGTPRDRPGMALERCRGFLPMPVADPAVLAEQANAAGWRVLGERHLCPACSRDRCAHTSTMRAGGRRVCADCGEPRT